jgi:hypothetical protein
LRAFRTKALGLDVPQSLLARADEVISELITRLQSLSDTDRASANKPQKPYFDPRKYNKPTGLGGPSRF